MHREIAYDPVFDAQEHYRLLLDAMARPGSIRVLPRVEMAAPEGLTAGAALVGFALLNADVTFYADGGETATRYLVVNTSARPVDRMVADFVFAHGMSPADIVTGMKTGTLSYPEEGATLILEVERLSTEAQVPGNAFAVGLKGPGVDGERKFFVSGLNVSLLGALRECNMEFPLGIDLVLAEADRRIVCIPRSSRILYDNN